MRRYPGITPFKPEDASVFKGRKLESQEVKNLVLTQKMLVLFAKSGMGKTSLLNAGVVPGLKKYGLYPVYIRFNEIGTETSQDPVDRFRDQYRQAYDGFYGGHASAEPFPPGLSLWETLCKYQLVTDGEVQIPVLIFDQFEEFFRTYPKRTNSEPTTSKKKARDEFLKQLAELLSDTRPHGHPLESQKATVNGNVLPLNLRAVFSIRSDMLNLMQEVSEYVPFVMRTRYELKPLTDEHAKQAIREPGQEDSGPYETGKIVFPEEVIGEILQKLKDPYSGEIESFQLQLVCSYLEDKYIQASKGSAVAIDHTVHSADYGGTDGIQRINEVYFSDTINSITAQPRQKIIGELGHLLNPNDNRILIEDSQLDLTAEVKKVLLGRRILKPEIINTNTYFEISHDKIALALRKEKDKLDKEIKDEQERTRKEQERLEAEKAEKERVRERNRLIYNSLFTLIGVLGIGAIFLFFQADEARGNAEESAIKTRRAGIKADGAKMAAERSKEIAEAQRRIAEEQKQLAVEALNDLNSTRLQNAWSDFELTKKLMAGHLFRQALANLNSLSGRIQPQLADLLSIQYQSYKKLSGLVSQAQRICTALQPIQNKVELAECLEQDYHLRCANDTYRNAQAAQRIYGKQYKGYLYTDIGRRINLTDSAIRDGIIRGLNGKDDSLSYVLAKRIAEDQKGNFACTCDTKPLVK